MKNQERRPPVWVKRNPFSEGFLGAVMQEMKFHIADFGLAYFEGKFLVANYGYMWAGTVTGHGKEEVKISGTTIRKYFGDDVEGNKFFYFKRLNDGRGLPPVPEWIKSGLEEVTGMNLKDYDALYVNVYPEGVGAIPHQDHSEDITTINYPIVSLSLGWSSSFYHTSVVKTTLAPTTIHSPQEIEELHVPKNNEETILNHGDVLVFGGGERLCIHSTSPLYPKLSPEVDYGAIDHPLGKLKKYRINLTLRRSAPLLKGMPPSPQMLV